MRPWPHAVRAWKVKYLTVFHKELEGLLGGLGGLLDEHAMRMLGLLGRATRAREEGTLLAAAPWLE